MKNILIIPSIILLLNSCGNTEVAHVAKTEIGDNIVTLTDAQLKNSSITIGKMEKKVMTSVIKVNGLIDVPPQNMVSVCMPLGGFLKSTKLLSGMHIAKGEVIATMEDQLYIQLQQDYLTGVANLKYAEAEYERQKELNQSKASSDKSFQFAEAEFRAKKIAAKSYYEKLLLIGINPTTLNENNLSRSINIVSPIQGFVSKVNVNIGKYVNPTDVLFELVNPDDIHLALTIFEKDLDKIYFGQKLTAYNNHHPETKYPCEIILIGKDISKERAVEVHCHFDRYDKTLIPGMFMNAELETDAKNTYAISDEGVVRFENKEFVFLVKDKNTFLMTEVKIGITSNGFNEIVPLHQEDLSKMVVVTSGAYTLLMKAKNVSDE